MLEQFSGVMQTSPAIHHRLNRITSGVLCCSPVSKSNSTAESKVAALTGVLEQFSGVMMSYFIVC